MTSSQIYAQLKAISHHLTEATYLMSELEQAMYRKAEEEEDAIRIQGEALEQSNF